MADDFVPESGVKKVNNTFILPDGMAWNLKKRDFVHESGNFYTQFIAVNVTELYKKREEMMREAQAELAAVALAAAEKVLQSSLNEEASRNMLDQFLSEEGQTK